MLFDNPKQAAEWLKEVREASLPVLGELERRATLDLSYYAGKQWANIRRTAFERAGGVTRLPTDLNPDSAKLRVTTNRVAPLIQKIAATTFPDRFDVEVLPPEADMGIEATVRAQTFERTVNLAHDAARFHACRVSVNFQRSVWGSYGFGWSLRAKPRSVRMGDAEMVLPDTEVTAFEFAPTDLILDPDNMARDLEDHDFVVYRSVWTVNKIKRRLGEAALKGVDADDLKTVGELSRFQLSCNEITDGQLFAQHRGHSKTKGAIVYQIHVKDEYGRFGQMYVALDTADEDGPRVLNFDAPDSPFGGSGLPLALYHAHRRTDGPWSLSDAAMLKDDQDKVNLIDTQSFRALQAYAHHKWAIDRNTIGRESSEDAYRNLITNSVGGPIFYTSGDRTRPGNAPQLLIPPQPPGVLTEMSRMYQEAMQRQSHRADVNMGATKSHVPDKSFKEAIEQADQVLGARVREDLLTDGKMLTVLLGTTIRNVQNGSPCTLAMLRRARFTPDALAVLAESDPHHIDAHVQVRESSVRFRSQNAKREDLNTAMSLKAISALEYRSALASSDIDTPITADDRFYGQKADRAAMRVLRGEEWTPVNLGEYAPVFLNAFRKALLGIEEVGGVTSPAGQRLTRAIESQNALALAATAMQQVAQSAGTGGGAAGGPQQEVPAEQSVMDILANLEQGGGSGVGAQPALVA